MFNKYLVSVFCYFIGVLLLLKVVLIITMFIWGYFGTPPIQLFDQRVTGSVRYLLFIQEIGTSIFYYLIVTAIKHFVPGHKEVATTTRRKINKAA